MRWRGAVPQYAAVKRLTGDILAYAAGCSIWHAEQGGLVCGGEGQLQ